MSTPAVVHHSELWDFYLENGRMPFVGDSRKPWTYRGWALPYVIEIHATEYAGIVNRWGYHLETHAQGKILDTHIPHIRFDGSANASVLKDIVKWVEIIDRDGGGWNSLLRLVDWLAFSLGVGDQPHGLNDKVNEELYRAVNLGPWLQHPHDYLGVLMSEHHSNGWNPNGFYPTPHSIVEMMTAMLMDSEDMRIKTVCDPCVGTGRMLMHASNHSLCLYGMDKDPVVVAACKINGALYAPWLSWPFPAQVLGREVKELPPPPPAPIPIENDPEPVAVQAKRKRVDDRQGTLFGE